ncbi:MAG: PD40 domain-containing protein [Proteobacteria bacterium]|nr:PD40 domain-containing protein [Pseudomonadota bacterium]
MALQIFRLFKARRARLSFWPGLLLISPAFADAWDVTNTGQPYHDVEFSVTEGSWMSVDVSPDGSSLVFDLLGDLYTIPSSGGTATLIQGGPAMQRTPRFSHDGRRILFLSDATGADNVWIANADGSAAHAVTHEEHDMLMGPAWGPQDDSIAAVKIVASFSRMHASEIRLFDVSGGAGRVVVDTPANGRDVQEAVFSPDRRYLYYTERITDPHIYVDANHVNFVIRRRDLTTGATTEVAGGFGSAIAPQVSPDGRRLAFVRRVKDKTVLFTLDVETGEQRPVYDQLDRDIQADFVPHENYYPRYNWFPDNRHVVIWGKGHLFNIDTETGVARPIPFRVNAHHRITDAPRFSHDLAPDHFQVRAVRQVAVSPDGHTTIVVALGQLWVVPPGSNKPTRLTRSSKFEFDPAFSSNGKELAYVEWDDERGSTLKVLSWPRGALKNVVTSRGVVRHPAFSPDGKQLAYAIQEGDKSMSGYRAKSGVYCVPVTSGEPRFLGKGEEGLMFAPDGARLYFTRTDFTESQSIQTLVSTDLAGLDPRVHAKARDTDANELRLSPDGHWIAFKDRQQYYVAPIRDGGRPLTVGADSEEVPVRKLTTLGGYAITWRADSSAVHWLLGPQMHKAQVAGRTSGITADEDAPYASIDLDVSTDKPQGSVAFVNARLITMRGAEVIEIGTLVVTGNRITAVGPAGTVTIPPRAAVIDSKGKTLMPGLIDMHGHIDCCFMTGVTPQKQPTRYAALAYGVTTNFDPYTSDVTSYESTETALAGLTVSPRWIGSGRVIYGRSQKPDLYFTPIESFADAQRVMKGKQALGATFIKSYKQPTRRQRQELIRAGREAGIMVDVEGEEHFYNNVDMIIDGHTNLEHSLPIAHYYDDVVQLLSHSSTSNTPTLVVAFGELFGENYIYQTTRAWEEPKVRAYVQETTSDYSALAPLESAPPHVRAMTSIHVADELWDIGFRSVARSVKDLDEAGVLINVGSHGQLAGLAMHWEMWLMAEGGMSNARILRAATLNGARALALDGQIGSLDTGKLADLIVLDRNPLEDIHNSNSVRYTMLNGRLYDSTTLNEIGNHPRPRGKFYWESGTRKDSDWNEAWAQ